VVSEGDELVAMPTVETSGPTRLPQRLNEGFF
jgi:hypothetical protein